MSLAVFCGGPSIDSSRAVVSGVGGWLRAGGYQRAETGHGVAVQHGAAVVRRPIEAMDPEEYKKGLRNSDEEEKHDPPGPADPGNPEVDFRGEKRGNKTHRSTSDPGCRFVSKGGFRQRRLSWICGQRADGESQSYPTGSWGGNLPQQYLGGTRGVELARPSQAATAVQSQESGADKGFFHEEFIRKLFRRKIEPHIAADRRGSRRLHMRVRMRQRGQPYYWSQRCRKKIEELFGEGKEFHGLRRFQRRRLYRVREETWLIGWVLNLKRLAKLLIVQPEPA
jgi:hypothetical protein